MCGDLCPALAGKEYYFGRNKTLTLQKQYIDSYQRFANAFFSGYSISAYEQKTYVKTRSVIVPCTSR